MRVGWIEDFTDVIQRSAKRVSKDGPRASSSRFEASRRGEHLLR
jgi:hypothetical protein